MVILDRICLFTFLRLKEYFSFSKKMIQNSINGLKSAKFMSWIPVEGICFVYGIFCCVLASFGILFLLLARGFIDPVSNYEGVSRGFPFDFYEEADKADEIQDLSLDFDLKNLNSENLPLTGYGLILYVFFFGSFIFSVLLCYGVHKRNPGYLKTYLLFGFTLTAFMFLCFFYLCAWLTDITFYYFVPMYMTLGLHLAVRCIIRKTQQRYEADEYHEIVQLHGFYIKHS